MKTASKVVLCGTSALFAVVLGLQAQTSTTSNNTTRSSQSLQSSPTTTSNNQTDSRYSSPSTTTSNNQSSLRSSAPGSATSNSTRDNSRPLSSSTSESDRSSSSAQDRRDSTSSSLSSSSSLDNSTTSNTTRASGSLNAASSETNATLAGSTSTSVTAETDTKVTTLVQEIEAQGPVVVQRIATQFSDFACTEENARMLVEALHGGTAVTLTGEDGQTVTFEPNVRLNYGEAYLALALAAETLRANGVSDCATPEQWRAVLVGGPIVSTTTTTTTASAGSDFPGILVLHSQGQGWSQIAQTSNVEISQIVSTAHNSLNIESSSNLAGSTGEMDAQSDSSTRSSSESSLSSSSGEYDSSKRDAQGHDKSDKKDKKDKWQDRDNPPRASDRGEEKKSDRARENTPPRN